MADLIDRQAAFCNDCPDNGKCSDKTCYVKTLPAVDAVEVGRCEGCAYSNRKRPQKCSCCRRNPDMKDCYVEEVG